MTSLEAHRATGAANDDVRELVAWRYARKFAALAQKHIDLPPGTERAQVAWRIKHLSNLFARERESAK